MLLKKTMYHISQESPLKVICIALVIIVSLGTIESSPAFTVSYARYPALSPDGLTLAFTYMGDIWTVPSSGGTAVRLTVHPAEDIMPHFSPDGSKIMFSSDRFDNYDVFVIPTDGGQPEQLTFTSATELGSSWFAGGDSVLFTSRLEGWADIYKMSADGGTPIKLTGYMNEKEHFGRISSDGRYLVYCTGSGDSNWWRRDLRGSRNSDIFILDRNSAAFTSQRITDFAGHDLWPVLNEAKNEIYFVSNRDGNFAQVWKIPRDGSEAVALTSFDNDGAQWLNSNPAGDMLVFEQNFKIWLLNPGSGSLREIPIDIKSDDIKNVIEKKIFKDNVEYFALSPDGKKIAAVIHGELYVIPSEEPKEGRALTLTSARESYPAWGQDSRTIYYASDVNGNHDIFSVNAVTGEQRQITRSPENDLKPIVSPDGKYLAFYRGLNDIIRYDLEKNTETAWVKGNFGDFGIENSVDYGWSPDSRWLAYAVFGPTLESDIYAVNLDGQTYNLSLFCNWNSNPRFSSDGKILYFTSASRYDSHTYKIDLQHKPMEFFEAALDSLFKSDEKGKDKGKKVDEKKDGDSTKIEPVKIDFGRITDRRARAFQLSASDNHPVLSPDGKKFYFVSSLLGKADIWSVNVKDDPDLKQLTKTDAAESNLTISSDGKKLYYLEGGVIKSCVIDGGKTTALTFKAPLEIDLMANNRQKFLESWQMLNEYFYDASFHGADWKAAREKYRPLLDHVRTDTEFENIMFELFGELRASHLWIYGKSATPSELIQTGATGIWIDYRTLDREGHFAIDRVFSGSPANRAGIKPGQYLRTINGTALSKQISMHRLTAGTVGRRVVLGISDTPHGKILEVPVKPITIMAERELWYKDWVAERRAMVDEFSGGRLAYIHIPEMSEGSLEDFTVELVSIAEAKEGLIIDVRDNGGGHIAVHLLGMLIKSPYIMRSFRNTPATSENKMRSKAVEKPMVLLINEYSGSNSEIFAEGFRKLGLGKIIGTATSGGVIGTSSYALIDGTRIRRPSTGSYTTDMEDTDLYPRQPDIYVENLPDDFINGRDPQLVRAVEELLKELVQ